MRRRLIVLTAGIAIALAILGERPRAADQVLIAAGSSWKYNDTGANLGTIWRSTGYSDAAWPSGAAQFGYGDADEATVLSFGGNASAKYITYYFRKSFSVPSPASVVGLTLRVVRDDGCVVYLNGAEVWRSNMPAGTITSTTLASVGIGDSAENSFNQVTINPAQLVAGTNLIAVEVHQNVATSSDLSFDLELLSTTSAPAGSIGVTLVSPADDGVVNNTNATFTADVSATAGLANATVLIGGSAQNVTLTGPAQIEDAQITADTPTLASGSALSINVDGQAPHAHGLMKFPSLVGGGVGQVPAGSLVSSAVLSLNCTNPGTSMRLFRLTQSWVENEATWNQRQTGALWGAAGADGPASNTGASVAGDCTAAGQRQIDLTRFVQDWVDGQPNFGFVMTDSGTDGVDFSSSESATPPVLTVVFTQPSAPFQTVPLNGQSALATFQVTLPSATTFNWNVEVTDTNGLKQRAPVDFVVTVDLAAPDEPVLISPANGATDVGLSSPHIVQVGTPAGGNVTATASIRKASGAPFTIVALPDTQHYSEVFPAIFTAQTQWIVAQKASRNIVFVTQEGDLVENSQLTVEWDRANTSMSLLDGVVPYGMAPGNHDLPSNLYNQYFPFSRYVGQPWYGGHYQSLNDNNFQLFSGGGIDFVAVHLVYCPPAGAVAWAKSVFDAYPNRIGMMTTHGYLNTTAQRTVHLCGDTSYLWNNLGAVTPSLHFMLSGHVHGESRREDTASGHQVFQMLADYQDRPSGGEGWLRILRFVPAENLVRVQTYSPWLNAYETDADSDFTLPFPMSAPWTTGAPVAVPSGSNASFSPTGLQPSTSYEWRVTVTNSAGVSRTGPVWTFTTGTGAVNQPPFATSAVVGAIEDSPVGVTVAAGDPEGQPITYTLVQAPAHGALTGTFPNLTYAPVANFNGSDAFQFRVSDGSLSSSVATVTLQVSAVNDAPVASGESYSVTTGFSLTTAAPGVLANDADVDGPGLTAQLVSGPAHGVLSLNSNGGFTYTPAAGYLGSDAFSYRATDGTLASASAVVGISVIGTPPGPLFSVNFATGVDGFTYVDDAFLATSQPLYASGSHLTNSGYTGGALRTYIGGVDNYAVNDMSGGWRRSFSLSGPAAITLTFRYRMEHGKDYESNEISQVLASLNGVLVGGGAGGYIAQLVGDGNNGPNINTGWRIATIDLGVLAAGTHTLALGGYNNRKDSATERTMILIDDVSVVVR